jgi:hypothetical protein
MKDKQQVIFTKHTSSMPQIDPDYIDIKYIGFDNKYPWQARSTLRMIIIRCIDELELISKRTCI